MGMYNEVHKRCYNCGAKYTLQIPQVILGFGNFDLDYPDASSIQQLTHEQKLELKKYVEEYSFYCGHDSCNSAFEVEVNVVEYRGKTVVTI